MENEISISKNVSQKSNLKDSMERTNKELAAFYKSILVAKAFNYEDCKVALFAEKVLNKYINSVIQINLTSLSTKKSIWIQANDFIDLFEYEKNLLAYAITLSHIDFSVVLDDYKEKVRNDVLRFASDSFEQINTAMGNYAFYIENVIVKNYHFDDSDKSLNIQLELIIDVR